jgi:predicted nucleotidyltransferase
MPGSNLAESLFGLYRSRVLSVLLLHPERGFYVRELARMADVPAGSIHRELKKLESSGLLIRSSLGNQVHYQANRQCPVFEELSGFFRKTSGLADVLREALAEKVSGIDFAFVFGSVASGRERASSDVDLLVVGDISFEEVVGVVHLTSSHLAREVNPVVMTTDTFRDKLLHGDPFVKRIVNGPKILVVGSPDDLGEPAADRAIEGAPD